MKYKGVEVGKIVETIDDLCDHSYPFSTKKEAMKALADEKPSAKKSKPIPLQEPEIVPEPAPEPEPGPEIVPEPELAVEEDPFPEPEPQPETQPEDAGPEPDQKSGHSSKSKSKRR